MQIMTTPEPAASDRRDPQDRITRIDLGVLAWLVLVGVGLAIVILQSPLVVGSWLDDGIYLATAKALADGVGYRHIELPGEPYQTKYPILYPFVISLVWRIFPDFPDNVRIMQVLNVVFWTAGSWIAYLLVRRTWRLPWWLVACGVTLAFANTGTLAVIQTSMSEPLYFMLSMAALTLVVRAAAQKAGPTVWVAAIGGVLVSASYLTRAIGVTLIAACVAELLIRRRWRLLIVVGILMGLGVGGWQAWCAYAAKANAAVPVTSAFGYNLDYSSWIPSTPGELARVVFHNTAGSAIDYLSLLIPPPQRWISDLLSRGTGGRLLLYACLLAVSGLTLLGLAAAWRRSRTAIHIYLLFYLGLVWVWPMSPMRLFLPVLPLLLTASLAGLFTLVLLVCRFVLLMPQEAATNANGETAPWWFKFRAGSRPATIAAVAVVCVLSYKTVGILVAQPGKEFIKRAEQQREGLIGLLRSHTPPDAVICATDTGYLHLRTQRKFVPFLPYEKPIPHLYPSDRRFSDFNRGTPEGTLAADLHLMETQLEDYLRTTGATYLVPARDNTTYGMAFDQFRRSRMGHFREAGTAGPHILYEYVPNGL